MQGPFPFGVACVAVCSHRRELLVQFWDLPWLLVRHPRLGVRYRRYVVEYMSRRSQPYWGDYGMIGVRLGDGWPPREGA